jgi:hypothetical protein
MSKLGKNLLWVALVGALVAVGAGVMVVLKNNGVKEALAHSQAAEQADQQQITKKTAENKALAEAKDASDKQLADANTKISDMSAQVTQAQKDAADAKGAVAAANDAAQKAKDALDAINKTLDGKTPQDYKDAQAKAEADLAASQAEQKILQDQMQAANAKVADLMDALNRSKTGTNKPGVSGKITFVDRTWNFVVLDIGESDGVVPNGELIVYRGRNFLGKVKVTKVDPNDAVAEILPDVKGNIQIGDAVLN